MEIGKLVKNLRLKKGLTQEELSEKTDISVRTIQRIENGEVDPRAYTLQAIAQALEVDFDIFSAMEENTGSSRWASWLHLSGLLVLILPPIIIWMSKKDKVPEVSRQGMDVINYQLSISLYLLPLLLFSVYPIALLVAVYSQVVILLNTVRVAGNKPYKYPFTIRFLK